MRQRISQARQRLDCGGTTPLWLQVLLSPGVLERTVALALPRVQGKRGHVPAVQRSLGRRLVAAFVRERKSSRPGSDRAASKRASKLAHCKRWGATVHAFKAWRSGKIQG